MVPWVGCKATQIKCGKIPKGNNLLNQSSLHSHLLPSSEGALITLLRHTHPDLIWRYIIHPHSEVERSKDPESLCRLLLPPRDRCQRTRYKHGEGFTLES